MWDFGLDYFDGTTSGHLTSRLTNDVNVMMEPIRSSLSTLLYNLITLVGGVTMCYVTSYQLSLLAFVIVHYGEKATGKPWRFVPEWMVTPVPASAPAAEAEVAKGTAVAPEPLVDSAEESKEGSKP